MEAHQLQESGAMLLRRGSTHRIQEIKRMGRMSPPRWIDYRAPGARGRNTAGRHCIAPVRLPNSRSVLEVLGDVEERAEAARIAAPGGDGLPVGAAVADDLYQRVFGRAFRLLRVLGRAFRRLPQTRIHGPLMTTVRVLP